MMTNEVQPGVYEEYVLLEFSEDYTYSREIDLCHCHECFKEHDTEGDINVSRRED